jgi:esterase
MEYTLMAKDVVKTLRKLNINLAHIVGHSMGGKVTAALALFASPEFKELDIVSATIMDISPVDYSGDTVFTDVYATLDVVTQLDSQIAEVRTRQEVSMLLEKLVTDPVLKAFLLSNVQPAEAGGFEWKFAVEGIDKSRSNLAVFNTESDNSGGASFERPALVMKGSDSKFVRSSHMATISSYFPLFTLLAVKNAGHWVHAEKPEESANALLKFLTTVEERYKISERYP